MRVRRERMLKHFNEGTYAAIERESLMREEQERRFKAKTQQPKDLRVDTTSAEEKARAAAQALKGQSAA